MGKYEGKHAAPTGPEERAARRELRARRRRESRAQRWADAWRFGLSGMPVAIASGFMEQTDVPWLLHPFLMGFGALLPMAAIGMLGTAAVNAITERRARRLAKPRPRLCYLFLALGWGVAAGAFRLVGWAGGRGPDGGDWIVAAFGWLFMISACAALMMIIRAITVRAGRRPAWLARLGKPGPSSSSVAPAGSA